MSTETVNSVTGPIPVEDLGVTLMHEHILIGYPGWEADTLHPGPSREEMIAIAIDKIQSMQAQGIQSMLDPCPNDLGRDVTLAAEVSSKTGFTIICATGLYKQNEGGALPKRPALVPAQTLLQEKDSSDMGRKPGDSHDRTYGRWLVFWLRRCANNSTAQRRRVSDFAEHRPMRSAEAAARRC